MGWYFGNWFSDNETGIDKVGQIGSLSGSYPLTSDDFDLQEDIMNATALLPSGMLYSDGSLYIGDFLAGGVHKFDMHFDDHCDEKKDEKEATQVQKDVLSSLQQKVSALMAVSRDYENMQQDQLARAAADRTRTGATKVALTVGGATRMGATRAALNIQCQMQEQENSRSKPGVQRVEAQTQLARSDPRVNVQEGTVLGTRWNCNPRNGNGRDIGIVQRYALLCENMTLKRKEKTTAEDFPKRMPQATASDFPASTRPPRGRAASWGGGY